MNSLPPFVSDLVLIGGGHAHVHVLKMLGMPEGRKLVLEQGIRVTLIARDVHTPYSGMLPGYVAGHYTLDEIHLDLERICRFSNVRLIHASAVSVTYNKNGGGMVECDDGRPPVRYDALSFDIGSTPAGTPPGLVTPVKPISQFAAKYNKLVEKMEKEASLYSPTNPFTLLVVGGGAGGIELACSVEHSLSKVVEQQGLSKDCVKVVVATRGEDLLVQHNTGVRRIFQRILREKGIDVHYKTTVVDVKPTESGKKVTVSKDGVFEIQFDECLWCTNAGASVWMTKNTPFATTPEGFIRVSDTYECINHPGVFAAGDCCHMDLHPRPKAGVFAVRAGPPLKDNLLYFLTQKPLVPHKPQSTFLGLISTGDPYAILSRGSWFALEGWYLWLWKDYIDRKWMEKYTVLPDLEEMMENMDMNLSKKLPSTVSKKGPEVMAAFAAEAMRCGGCGAKVGANTVSRVLNAIHKRQKRRAKQFNLVEPPPIDHDDAAVVPVPKGGGAMINTIDYFRSFVSDPFVFGKIAAVHALSDVHAMGANAQTALALAVVPFAADEEITECTLLELLSGASDILQDENVQIVGGHTCEGEELACGFAIQGFTSTPEKLLRKRGGKPGDKIVLTKPLGTGALFAADMRAKCKGEYVLEALASMCVSNVKAGEIAARTEGVHSCTDVTGFGLAGHLLEMLVAEPDEQIGAVLDLQEMPFLRGGIEASSQQIFSSLQPENARSRRAVSNHVAAAAACPVEYPLLFDPQTAGGLMFFVHPDACEGFVKELRQCFPSTCVIGDVVPYVEDAADMNGVCTIGSGGRGTGLRLKVKYAHQNGVV